MQKDVLTPGQFAIIEDEWLQHFPSEASAKRQGQNNPMQRHGLRTHEIKDHPDGMHVTLRLHWDLDFYKLWNRVANFCADHDLIHTIETGAYDGIILRLRPSRF